MRNIIVHHLNHSRSDRIIWLLEELGIPYQVQVHLRRPEGFAPSSLKKVTPMGKSPAVEIDGKIYTESGAIIHKILSGAAKPAGIEKHESEASTFWSYFSEGTLMLHLQPTRVAQLIERQYSSSKRSEEEKRGAKEFYKLFGNAERGSAQAALEEAEAFLANHQFFSGTDEMGIGDFMMSFPLNNIAYGGRTRLFNLGPASLAYVDRMRARPAWKAAQKRMAEEEAAAKQGPKL